MDFDDLKRAWDDYDHTVASGIRLKAEKVRAIVTVDTAAGTHAPRAGEIDYTMPVALAQKQLDGHRIMGFVRSAAALGRNGDRGDQLVRKFHSIVMRLLGGRHRTLGG